MRTESKSMWLRRIGPLGLAGVLVWPLAGSAAEAEKSSEAAPEKTHQEVFQESREAYQQQADELNRLVAEALDLGAKGQFEDADKKFQEALAKFDKKEVGQGSFLAEKEKEVKANYKLFKEGWASKIMVEAQQLAKDGKFQEAISTAQRAQVQDMEHKYIRDFIEECQKQIAGAEYRKEVDPKVVVPDYEKEQSEIDYDLREAKIFFRNKQYESACARLERVLLIDPFNMDAIELLSHCYDRLFESGKARTEANYAGYSALNIWEWIDPIKQVQIDQTTAKQANVRQRNNSNLYNRLERIVFPSIPMKDSTLMEVITFLNEKSRQYDPEKEGVTIIENLSPMDKERKINFELGRTPLLDAIRYLSMQSGLSYTFRGDTVVFGNVDGMSTEFFPVRGDIIAEIIDSQLEKLTSAGMASGEENGGGRGGMVQGGGSSSNGIQSTLGNSNADGGGMMDMMMGGGANGGNRTSSLSASAGSLINGPAKRNNSDMGGMMGPGMDMGMGAGGAADAGAADAGGLDPMALMNDPMMMMSGPVDGGAGMGSAGGVGMGGGSEQSRASSALKSYFMDRWITFDNGASILYSPRGERLVVKNTPENLQRMHALLKQLDALEQPMILVEAKLIELTNTNLNELGFDWTFSASPKDGDADDTWSFSTNDPLRHGQGANEYRVVNGLKILPNFAENIFGSDTNVDMSLSVNAVAQNTRSEVLASPRILAESGQRDPAKIQMTEKTYFITEWEKPDVNSNGFTLSLDTPQPEWDDAYDLGVTFTVRPSVESDNYTITLEDIHPIFLEHIADEDHPVVYETGQVYGGVRKPMMTQVYNLRMPIIARREMLASISLYDGETILLGGMADNESIARSDKWPLLGKIPLIGTFFSDQQTDVTNRSMLIFISARLVNPNGVPLRTVRDRGLIEFNR